MRFDPIELEVLWQSLIATVNEQARALQRAAFSPIVREDWRLPLPRSGAWAEMLNTDSRFYAGSDVGNGLGITADRGPMHGQPASALITLPPLAALWLVPA